MWFTVSFLVLGSVLGVLRGGPRSTPNHKVSGHERVLAPHGLVSADPGETVIAPIIEAIGADSFLWASDYPHIDASFGVVGEIRSRLVGLTEEDQAKVLGLNAQRFCGLEVPAVV